MEIIRLMAMLLLIILIIVIGLKYVNNERFAVLTGTVVTNPAESSASEQIGTINLNLPDGFTSNNCVVISAGYAGDHYSYGETGWSLNCYINDNTNKLNIEAYYGRSLGETYNLPIKVVLMNIN